MSDTNVNVQAEQDAKDEHAKVVSDSTIHAVLPNVEELVVEKKPLSETTADELLGSDMPVSSIVHENFNEEDEEAEKQEDPLL